MKIRLCCHQSARAKELNPYDSSFLSRSCKRLKTANEISPPGYIRRVAKRDCQRQFKSRLPDLLCNSSAKTMFTSVIYFPRNRDILLGRIKWLCSIKLFWICDKSRIIILTEMYVIICLQRTYQDITVLLAVCYAVS